MASQRAAVVNAGEQGEFSFFEALTFDSKEPSLNIRELGLPSSPRSLRPTSPAPPEKNTTLRRTVTTSNSPSNPTERKPATNMAPPKVQAQCLDLCQKTTTSIDLISVRILEYLTITKQLPYGFEPLARDFVHTCQILFAIEAGLRECNHLGQGLPQEMVTELGQKFQVTQADFSLLNQILAKMLVPPNRITRGWGKLFGDNDIKKISIALAKTRASLRMSSLVFQWSLGNEKNEMEKGIGYTALVAALDKMDHGVGNEWAKQAQGDIFHQQPQTQAPSQVPPLQQPQTQALLQEPPLPAPPPQHLSALPFGVLDVPNALQQHQQQPVPWPKGSSSIQHEGSLGIASRNEVRVPLNPAPRHLYPLSPEFRTNSAADTLLTTSTASGLIDSHEPYDQHSLIDSSRPLTNITEPDSSYDYLAELELGSSKVVRLSNDPTSMPRLYPRNPAEGDTSNMQAMLISAVRGNNHKLIEQLLHRGVSANTGPNVNALKEAILAQDEESVRLLLLFGADPNDPSIDGITPLFLSVEKSFLAGATILLKYGADPNLVAGPDLESPLAITAMANMVGFSHLLLMYNGDANCVTANGTPLLTSAIQKKTPRKFIDLLLDYGSNPNAKSREGKTALFEAIQVGRADIVASLLEHGADPNLPGPKHMLWPSTYQPPCLQVLLSHGADPKKCPGIMELAASINNIESVRILLKAGVSPDTKKDGVYTPLCTAIRDDRPDMLKLLLSNGADPNVPASEYPAFKCVTHNRVHFLPLLVSSGANLHSPKGILETAVSSNNVEALNWLLDQGLNPNDRNPKGMTPLTTAIRENRIELVDLLLLRGADPHTRGQDWPICMAVRNPPILKRLLDVASKPQAFRGIMEMAVSANQLDSIKLLLAAGVSVEDRNGGVFSPLTTAIREDRREIVAYLLNETAADVNAPGEHLPIVKALRRYHGEGDTDIIELLLDRGADPNKIYRGWNGIMQAIENGDAEVLRLLCRKVGADLEVKDELGRTIIEMATSTGWDEGAQILKEGDLRLRSKK